MNRRKIKTSRTFYGKSDISDLQAHRRLLARRLHNISGDKKVSNVCGQKSRTSQTFLT
jgi:hypothetical protein